MKRILVVNVDPHTIVPPFARQDVSIDYAPDARYAMRLAAENNYLLGFFGHDLNMLNGIQLFRGIKVWQPHMFGVLISQYANLNLVNEAVTAGIGRILPCPVECAHLRELLELLALGETSASAPWSVSRIADLSNAEIVCLSRDDLIKIIRQVDYPYSGKDRLEYFDRDTLERVAHLVRRWCAEHRSSDEVEVTLAEGAHWN